jgi:hypothetical protein
VTYILNKLQFSQMVCHFCLDHSQFREANSNLEFCDRYCQIGYHIVRISGNSTNPLEYKDTIFTTLLQVPPSQLFRLYNVSKKFRRILQDDNSFKVAYVAKWEISDEFYLKAKWYYHEWMPYLNSYHGYLARQGTRDEIFTAAVIQYRFDIMVLMLENLSVGRDAVKWCITAVIQRDHYEDILYLRELFKYAGPCDLDLENAVTEQLDPDIIELILSTGAITYVENAIRWAAIHGNESLVRRLFEYQETLTAREGVLKRQKNESAPRRD